jgi:hypothetical protein
MRVLFLDQNKWIDLARGMKDASHAAAPVFQKLRQEVEAGRAICPLTITQILETAKRNDLRTRSDVATAQAILSRGHVYRSRKARLLVEIRNALHQIFGEDPVALPNHWAIVPGFTQAFETFDTAVGEPAQVRITRFLNQHLDPATQYLDFMLNQDDTRRREDTLAFTAGSASLLTRIEERRAFMTGSSMDLRYRAYAARLLLDHQGFVAHMLQVIGHTVEEMKALGGEAVVQFMRNVPSLDVEAHLAARLESQTGALEVNDIRDVLSFYTAIPYSERLVSEKNFISLARQAKLDKKYNVALHTNLEEVQALWQ